MNFDLNKRPLSETVKRHGSSKLFLMASIFGIISTAVSFLYTLFSYVLGRESISIQNDIGVTITTEMSLLAVINSAASTVFCIIGFAGLIKLYSYCKGNGGSKNGLNLFLTMYKVDLIVSGALVGVLVLWALIASFIPFGVETFLLTFFVALFLFILPAIGGTIVLIIFMYRSVRKTIEYANFANNDIACGKVSVFLIVITIIGIASYGTELLSVLGLFGIDAMDFENTAFFSGFISLDTILNCLNYALAFVSQLFFLITLFKFKKDMTFAETEWQFIQQRKAVMASYERARAEADARAKAEAEARANEENVNVPENNSETTNISAELEQITHEVEKYPEDKEYFTEPGNNIEADYQIFTDDINFN